MGKHTNYILSDRQRIEWLKATRIDGVSEITLGLGETYGPRSGNIPVFYDNDDGSASVTWGELPYSIQRAIKTQYPQQYRY